VRTANVLPGVRGRSADGTVSAGKDEADRGPGVILKPKRKNAKLGQTFERLIEISGQGVVSFAKFPNGYQHIGGGKGFAVKTPCDFGGTIIGTGRAIFWDAKRCEAKTRFPIGNRDHFPDHQRLFLQHQHEAGAVAGLMVEDVSGGRVLWLSWFIVGHWRDLASIEWGSDSWIDLGPSNRVIDFTRIPGVKQ